MRGKILFAAFVLWAALLPGDTVVVLPEIKKPAFDITVDNDELLVIQCATIYVYSLKDFKLKTSFGRRGEGPREFKVHPQEHIHFSLQPDSIIVDCGKKVSYFTRNGIFKNEIRIPRHVHVGALNPLADQFVGFTEEFRDNIRYVVLGLYDSNFQRVKEICRNSHVMQKKEIVYLRGTFHYKVYRDHIYVVYADGDFRLDRFDRQGNLEMSINESEVERRRTSALDRRRVRQWFELYLKGFWEKNRWRIKFRDYWPAIGTFFIDNDIIYIATFVVKKDKWLCYLYDLRGNFLEKIYLPLVEHNIWAPFPYTIADNKLFQLIDNEETEQWELHITPLDDPGRPDS